MKRGEDVSTFLRRYFDGDPEARFSIYLTSADQDHAAWSEFLKTTCSTTIYIDALSAPHHGSAEGQKGAFGAWRARRRALKRIKRWQKEFELNRATEQQINQKGPLGVTPPRIAEFALLMIPARSREDLLGCLEEEYRTVALPRHGRVRADFWYWSQTFFAVGRYLWPLIQKVLGLAVIWKLIRR